MGSLYISDPDYGYIPLAGEMVDNEGPVQAFMRERALARIWPNGIPAVLQRRGYVLRTHDLTGAGSEAGLADLEQLGAGAQEALF